MKVILATITSILIPVLTFLSSAHSTVVQYDLDSFASKSADAIVTVDDVIPGVLGVNDQGVPGINSGNVGDITGGFNLSNMIGSGDIVNLIDGPIIDFESNTRNFGQGIDLRGGGSNNPGLFDVGLQYRGFNVDDVQDIEFLVSSLTGALSIFDFNGFGLRLQSVGVKGKRQPVNSILSGFNPKFPVSALESATMALL